MVDQSKTVNSALVEQCKANLHKILAAIDAADVSPDLVLDNCKKFADGLFEKLSEPGKQELEQNNGAQELAERENKKANFINYITNLHKANIDSGQQQEIDSILEQKDLEALDAILLHNLQQLNNLDYQLINDFDGDFPLSAFKTKTIDLPGGVELKLEGLDKEFSAKFRIDRSAWYSKGGSTKELHVKRDQSNGSSTVEAKDKFRSRSDNVAHYRLAFDIILAHNPQSQLKVSFPKIDSSFLLPKLVANKIEDFLLAGLQTQYKIYTSPGQDILELQQYVENDKSKYVNAYVVQQNKLYYVYQNENQDIELVDCGQLRSRFLSSVRACFGKPNDDRILFNTVKEFEYFQSQVVQHRLKVAIGLTTSKFDAKEQTLTINGNALKLTDLTSDEVESLRKVWAELKDSNPSEKGYKKGYKKLSYLIKKGLGAQGNNQIVELVPGLVLDVAGARGLNKSVFVAKAQPRVDENSFNFDRPWLKCFSKKIQKNVLKMQDYAKRSGRQHTAFPCLSCENATIIMKPDNQSSDNSLKFHAKSPQTPLSLRNQQQSSNVNLSSGQPAQEQADSTLSNTNVGLSLSSRSR